MYDEGFGQLDFWIQVFGDKINESLRGYYMILFKMSITQPLIDEKTRYNIVIWFNYEMPYKSFRSHSLFFVSQ